MFDVFVEFVSMAAFFALHGLIVLGIILIGLTLQGLANSYFERQKQKALEMFYKNDRG